MTIPKDCTDFVLPAPTARLILEPISQKHLETSLVLCSHPDICRYIRPAIPRESVIERIDNCARPWRFHERTWCSFAAIVAETGNMVGEVVFRVESVDDLCGEIGFRFLPETKGTGYALEASKVVLELMFSQLNLHKVVAYCEVANIASFRLLEKLGLRREGTLREAAMNGPDWKDLYTYGILVSDPR